MSLSKTNIKKIGLVVSLFNSEVTQKLRVGAKARLKESGLGEDDLVEVEVPGAFEIPLACQWLLRRSDIAGVVALGAVIRGETAHFDYVCRAAEEGCLRVSLDSGKPVGFGVLTTDTEEQALARCGGPFGHKGQEAAQTVLDMLKTMEGLPRG